MRLLLAQGVRDEHTRFNRNIPGLIWHLFHFEAAEKIYCGILDEWFLEGQLLLSQILRISFESLLSVNVS